MVNQAETTQSEPGHAAKAGSEKLLLVLAFFAIYVLWGTTFLAIRVAVHELPPLFAAGARFFIAGILLYGFMRLKRTPHPTALEWRNLAVLGFLMFVADYGPLFWAEKYVPSGIASVLVATVPLTTIGLEMFVFHQQKFRAQLLVAVLLGFLGTAVLLYPGRTQHLSVIPCLAILGGAVCWALGAVLNHTLRLPASKSLSAGAAMLLGGVGLLALSAAFGELKPLPHVSLRAAGALLYLIIFGSILGFSAFMWLLARMPATRVSSHSYVNPIVAVALGYFAAAEPITPRMLAGAAIVVISVFLVLGKEKAAI